MSLRAKVIVKRQDLTFTILTSRDPNVYLDCEMFIHCRKVIVPFDRAICQSEIEFQKPESSLLPWHLYSAENI